jgi:phosphoribosyl-AMP cyclohydrolase
MGPQAGDTGVRFAERKSVEQVELGLELAPKFDADGLVPVVTTDAASGTVLMLGWMNAEALRRTIETRQAHYWSRSRQALWHKGAHSGFLQHVEALLVDDDQDALILQVRLEGPGSCHVGYHSCFYRAIDLDTVGADQIVPLRMTETERAFDADAVYAGLENPTRL